MPNQSIYKYKEDSVVLYLNLEINPKKIIGQVENNTLPIHGLTGNVRIWDAAFNKYILTAISKQN